jgi:hypothetical protein
MEHFVRQRIQFPLSLGRIVMLDNDDCLFKAWIKKLYKQCQEEQRKRPFLQHLLNPANVLVDSMPMPFVDRRLSDRNGLDPEEIFK